MTSKVFQDAVFREPQELAEWMPLIMEGREKGEPVAATRAMLGTDVNFGSLTRALIDWLGKQDGVAVYLSHRVGGLESRLGFPLACSRSK